ncbi:MAG: hypothetical protein ACFFC1_13910 [Promethearchaeota archaeon]
MSQKDKLFLLLFFSFHMPDEFDFKNYKTMEEYSKSVEGTKYLHDRYLKAVNNPIRREILEIANKLKRISKKDLIRKLLDNKIIEDESMFNYHMDFLIKAFCIQSIKDEKTDEIFYEITQGGKVIEYFK